jgi:superfamily II DNA/RNA helicase
MELNQKDQIAILQKLGIDDLNPMQLRAQEAISQYNEVVLLSDTGTGKTLAFLLPLIAQLNPLISAIQILILVPSRELAIQIEQVIREMGSGYKANAIYGGRAGSKDKKELKHPPTILVGTPGRVADHIRRGTFDTEYIESLVLDEFDKILEVGFAEEMKEIISNLPALKKKVLTSATQIIDYPPFLDLNNPIQINFTTDTDKKLKVKTVVSKNKDTLETLSNLLLSIYSQRGIVFCNFKDSIRLVSDYLGDHQIDHACFYGGLEQMDRERALIKFRNGTHRILIATDLAARGIDVPEMDYIIHYELPPRVEEFTHRNGRTARMHAQGTAYVLKWQNQKLPSFIIPDEEFTIPPLENNYIKKWVTLFISGGRKDKISKGDIAGLFFKQGQLNKDELGVIELKQECAFVAVPRNRSEQLIQKLNNSRLKKKKVRISLLN